MSGPLEGKHNPVTYFLSKVPRSSNDHCVGLEVLHVYIAGAAHQQLERLERKNTHPQNRIPKCLFNWLQTLIINITHTSNSFSSNMASRFSGTSSFKPAIDQGVGFYARMFRFSGGVSRQRDSSPFRKCSTSSLTWVASLYCASRLR